MTPSGGAQVTYAYDNADRITQIAQGSSTVGFTYDDANRRMTLTLANGVTLTYGYDNADQLTSITYRDAASTLLGDLTYGYDLGGRRTSMGGSFARTGLPAAIASATYDVNNRLTNWNGASLSHDANGNLLGFGGDTYTWNKRDQVAAISGSNTASFQYDGVGRRQAKTISGTSTQFLYDGLNPIQEKAGSTITASLLTGLGIDEFLARSEGANTQHFLTDALGSTVRLTNGSAAKIVDYTYEPYGKASADAASTNAFQYTGRENDGTGLNYYRARYQHPALGRFISEDPIGLAGGLNVYAYVDGDPVLFSDPLGHQKGKGADTAVRAIMELIRAIGEWLNPLPNPNEHQRQEQQQEQRQEGQAQREQRNQNDPQKPPPQKPGPPTDEPGPKPPPKPQPPKFPGGSKGKFPKFPGVIMPPLFPPTGLPYLCIF